MTCQQVKTSTEEFMGDIPAGAHICHIYCNDEERDNILLNLLTSRLKLGECAICLSENANEREINTFFNHHDLSYGELLSNGAFMMSDSQDPFLRDNFFDPDRVTELLESYYKESKVLGFPGVCFFGEIPIEIQKVTDRNRLREYELRLGLLLESYPLISVCQYNANFFDGATIMEILKAHPFMVVQGAVVHNPLFASLFEFM